jgi:hypothetical protein
MQVVAFCTPSFPDWRWRIVDYGGQMVEESSMRFPSIASALVEGTRRLRDMTDRALSGRPSSALR